MQLKELVDIDVQPIQSLSLEDGYRCKNRTASSNKQ